MQTKANVEKVEPGSFAAVVADELVATILESVEDHGRCTLVLSGGSTPSAIYRLLARPPRVQEIPWHSLHLFLGDERWVPAEDSQSNYHMISETLLSHRKSPEANIHRIDTSASDPRAAAAKYEENIRSFFKLQPGELPVFDVVLLGVGVDGHTASIFPSSDVVSEHAALCRAVELPNGSGLRVTLTPPVLFSSRRVFFLVKGRDKAEIVRRIFVGAETADEIPAKLYEAAGERVTWFLCSEAARELDSAA